MAKRKRTAYQPRYCDDVIDFLAAGHSLSAFAGHIGACRKTLDNWKTNHPEFEEACDIARAVSALFWEKQLVNCAQTGNGNVTAIIFGLKNRVYEDWRDVTQRDDTVTVKVEAIERRIVDPIIEGKVRVLQDGCTVN